MTLTAIRPEAGFIERPRDIAVESGPGVFVDLGFQRGLEGLVGVVRAWEVGVAGEEAFLVVLGIEEPAGDAVGSVAADFAGGGVEDVDAFDPDLNPAFGRGDQVDIGLAEDDEEVAFAGAL